METANYEPAILAKLAKIRREKGLSQARLSELSGVSQAQISLLENRQYGPGLSTALNLARALGVSVEDLVE